MSTRIVILAEDALGPADVEHITSLHPADTSYEVLVPADTERNLLVSLIDHLSLGELREAMDDVLGREPEPARAVATAQEQLAETLELLRATGVAAEGQVVDDDPLPALRSAVGGRVEDTEIVVVTLPHALEDTFRRDWASRAREELRVPVLHLYLGTNRLG
ncbi:hypothetical protein [Actinotalea sp.]|uniref:hypothetical protein n=1 Tax=Actinotalea sp. TaxID=1872145 RepID=UPI0035675796